MVKFYIVDDEDMIREGLHFYFNWEELGAQVVGSQINGERAMPEILQLNPDVVITDVVMPKMDGIELAHQLRLSGYTGEIIFLSAYQEMSYVKTAFKFDAADFIFKPIQTDEFVTVIKNIIKTVNNKKEKQKLIAEAQKAVQDLEQLEMERLWLDLLYSERKEKANISYLQINRLMERVKEYSSFCVLLIYSSKLPTDLISKQLQILKKNPCTEATFIFSTIKDANTICEVIAFADVQENNVENKAKKLYDLLQQQFSPYKSDIIFKLGKIVRQIEDISISLKNARKLIAMHFAPGMQTPMPESEIEDKHFGQEFKARWGKKFEEAVLSKDDGKIESCVIAFLKAVLSSDINELNIIKANCMLLCFALCDNLHLTKSDDIFNSFISDASCILDCICVDEINVCFKKALMGLKEALSKQSSEVRFIRKIKAIISENLDNVDISVISKKMNISKNHLSSEFKKYTGITINDYITYERMEKAKQLLMEGNMYIYEVANQIGYKDVAYFSKLFKRTVGCLPAEFKERSG